MKNLEQRIAILETNHSRPLIDAFHELACRLAKEQDRAEPEKQDNLVNALEQLTDYLPN